MCGRCSGGRHCGRCSGGPHVREVLGRTPCAGGAREDAHLVLAEECGRRVGKSKALKRNPRNGLVGGAAQGDEGVEDRCDEMQVAGVSGGVFWEVVQRLLGLVEEPLPRCVEQFPHVLHIEGAHAAIAARLLPATLHHHVRALRLRRAGEAWPATRVLARPLQRVCLGPSADPELPPTPTRGVVHVRNTSAGVLPWGQVLEPSHASHTLVDLRAPVVGVITVVEPARRAIDVSDEVLARRPRLGGEGQHDGGGCAVECGPAGQRRAALALHLQVAGVLRGARPVRAAERRPLQRVPAAGVKRVTIREPRSDLSPSVDIQRLERRHACVTEGVNEEACERK